MRPQRVFLRIAIAFGTVLVFLTPPFQSPDEYLHFYRALQIANGQLVAERQAGDCYGYSKYFPQQTCLGGRLPRSVLTTVRNVSSQDLRFDTSRKQNLRDLFAVLPLPLNPEDRVFINFKTTALHSPVPYLPQALGIAVGKAFNLSPLLLMYAGRLANLAVWSSLLFLAIRTLPLNPWLFVALAITPMSLFLAASLSVDSLTNGIAFAFVGLAVAAAVEPQVKSRRFLWMGGLAVLLSLAKLAYFPLVFLLLAIPPSRWGSWRRYWLGVGGIFLASGVAVAGWSAVVADIYIPLHPELSPEAQIQFVLSHPLQFVATLGRTFRQDGLALASQFVGVFGWLDTPLPGFWVGTTWGMLLALAGFPVTSEGRLQQWQRLVLAIAALSSMVVLCGLAYLWNFVAAETIGGLQGRYFIPIVPVLGLVLSNRRLRLPTRLVSRLLVGYWCVLLMLTLVVLGDRYYNLSAIFGF